MSQYFVSAEFGPSPPDVPTSFITDSGTAIPSSNQLNVNGGQSTSNNANGLQTSGSGNTLIVELSNRLQGTGQTVGAVSDDIVTFDLGGSAAVYRFRFDIAGVDTGTGDGVGYSIFGSLKTDGATASLVGTPFLDADEDISLNSSTLELVASGNDAILRYTGVAGQTVNVSAVGYYVKVT